MNSIVVLSISEEIKRRLDSFNMAFTIVPGLPYMQIELGR